MKKIVLLRASIISLILFSVNFLNAQNPASSLSELTSYSDKLTLVMNKKVFSIEQKLDKQTHKYLSKLQKEEYRLKRKLAKRDSILAKQMFARINDSYSALKIADMNGAQGYSGHIDSILCALQFMKENNLVSNPEIGNTLKNVENLRNKLNAGDNIKVQLLNRQRLLKEQFQKLGLAEDLKRFQKQVYYYQAQVDEYKKLFSDSKKIEQTVLNLLSKWPSFQEFIQQNSQIAHLFSVPGSYLNSFALVGLQTRSQVLQSVSTQMASASATNVASVFAQQVQVGKSKLDEYKDKLASLGMSSGDADMPDFKPNSQKTKSFANRLEFSTNFQTTKSNSFFPTTTDLGVSVGYKLNDKSVIGLGASYKLGLGNGLNHIALSSQGMGLRSYLDVKLKGSIFLSGGMEYNYQQPYRDIQIDDISKWQQSGLVGISKTMSKRSKLVKKTKFQLLWDFLSYHQQTPTDHFKFRIAYNLN
jgi:hypothetical protein